MSVYKMNSLLQKSLDAMVSAVEQYATSETTSSTVGSQMRVSYQLNFASAYLIVKFQFGQMEVSHAISERTLSETTGGIKALTRELQAIAHAFVKDVIHTYNTFSLPDLAVALWEEAGIAIGGEW